MGFAGSDACCIALFHVILIRLLRDKIRSALMTELSGYFTTEQLGGDSNASSIREFGKKSRKEIDGKEPDIAQDHFSGEYTIALSALAISRG